ncbi:unnamed protein product [Brachionus calyciflorus]|uniref:G-protein coupled receptors family 1 profile domain-containing protein n=1 Tax=Brachionus calyciflorus TaxID=104777 RepID=A0A813UHA0_9BILA|nr:unnamed protein product [Brachionus calyciflorus]
MSNSNLYKNLIHNNYLEIDSNITQNLNLSSNSFPSLISHLNKNEQFFDSNNLTFDPWLTITIAIIASMMSLITIIGNVFVITAFIIDKNLRKYSNYFILNLSIADLLIGILIPPYAPFLLNKRLWKFGKLACTIWLVFDYVVGSASVLCIVVISLDRYLLVSRGLKYVSGQKVTKAIIIMLTVWSIAFFNYAPAIIFWEIISGRQTVKEGECQVAFHDNLVYLTATACVEFFAPLISICGLNLAVYLNIRKRSRGLIRTENPKFNLVKKLSKKADIINEDLNKTNPENEKLNEKVVHSISSSVSSSMEDLNKCKSIKEEHNKNESSYLIHDFDNDNRLKRKKSKSLISVDKDANHNYENNLPTVVKQTNRNAYISAKPKRTMSNNRTLTKDKKAARSLFILVFVFVFCWAPYTFLTLIKAVWPSIINDHVYEFSFWLLWFNSTLNPILYPFLHVKFRKAFCKILQYILFCFNINKKKGYTLPNNYKSKKSFNLRGKKPEIIPSSV